MFSWHATEFKWSLSKRVFLNFLRRLSYTLSSINASTYQWVQSFRKIRHLFRWLTLFTWLSWRRLTEHLKCFFKDLSFWGRFHQHFRGSCFAQLFSVTFGLRKFLVQGYQQKSARKTDGILSRNYQIIYLK